MNFIGSYITVCSHSRTWWINHACPQHNKKNSIMSPAGKGLASWLSFVVLNCVVVTFPFGILGQVWYLIVSISDLCPISYFHTVHILLHISAVLVDWPGHRLHTNWLYLNPDYLYQYNALDYSNFAYSYKMVCNYTKNKQKYAKHYIHSLICILHYVMPLNHN